MGRRYMALVADTALNNNLTLPYLKSILTSFGSDDEFDLPHIYQIPKMNENPYNEDSLPIHASVLSSLLTKLLYINWD